MSISIIAAAGCQVQPEMSTAASQKNRQESVFASKSSSQQDEVVKNNDYKKNLEQAKKEKRLFYTKEEKFFFGLITREAEYTYIAKRNETIADIRKKFNLKDGALLKCNSWIVDANAPLQEGKKIFFYEKDIKKNK